MSKNLKVTAEIKLELRELLMGGVSEGMWSAERVGEDTNSPSVITNGETKLCSVRSYDDARFIALARNYMASILDELEATQKEGIVQKTVKAQKKQATKRLQNKMLRPECFGTFRSPQSDAESCCDECLHNAQCFDIWFTGGNKS